MTPTPGPDGTIPVPGPEGSAPVDPGPGGEPPANTALATIQVAAGGQARDHSIVTFPFPDGLGKFLALRDSQGNQIPLQVAPSGDATFILTSMAAGEQATYTIEELPERLPIAVSAAQETDDRGQTHLMLKHGDTKVFRWTLEEDNFRGAAQRDVRAGYIYPLYTPSGLNVADDYQVDHPHMHGIWSAWTSTTFRGHAVDFWNGYANQGHVDLAGMQGIWSGSVHAGLIADIVHTDITTNPSVDALDETWTVTVYKTHEGADPYFIFDIASTQITSGNDPLVLEQYHYGGFGFRGSEQWQDPANVEYLTSEGHTRANGDGQNARWCAQFGTVDGQRAGFAAFDHPDNFRHPQGLRIHPSNPYWAFVPVTPLKGGRYTIEVGAPYVSHFRIVAFDGNADAALLDRLWADYAEPPTVTFVQ